MIGQFFTSFTKITPVNLHVSSCHEHINMKIFPNTASQAKKKNMFSMGHQNPTLIEQETESSPHYIRKNKRISHGITLYFPLSYVKNAPLLLELSQYL